MFSLFRRFPIRISRRKSSSDYFTNIESLIEQAIQPWLKQIELDLQQHLAGLVDQHIHALMRDGNHQPERSWHKTLEQLIGSSIGEWINPSKTSVSQRESERSHDAERSFRFSRGQQQKAAARTAMQGQRNL